MIEREVPTFMAQRTDQGLQMEKKALILKSKHLGSVFASVAYEKKLIKMTLGIRYTKNSNRLTDEQSVLQLDTQMKEHKLLFLFNL